MKTALELCLAPSHIEDFLEANWERSPLLIRRNSPEYFAEIFSIQELDNLIANSSMRYPAYRIIVNNKSLPPEDVPSGKSAHRQTTSSVLNRIYDAYASGATLLLQKIEKRSPGLLELAHSLQSTMKMPVQINAYLTPPNCQGFPVHYDTHDVMLLQITGCKHWQVWDEVIENPTKNQKYSVSQLEINEVTSKNKPIVDSVLLPGDTLYIPRGFPHVGYSLECDSLHLTVGFFPHRTVEVAKALIFNAISALEETALFSESLACYMSRKEDAEINLLKIKKIIKSTAHQVDLEAYLRDTLSLIELKKA